LHQSAIEQQLRQIVHPLWAVNKTAIALVPAVACGMHELRSGPPEDTTDTVRKKTNDYQFIIFIVIHLFKALTVNQRLSTVVDTLRREGYRIQFVPFRYHLRHDLVHPTPENAAALRQQLLHMQP
jgi:hypothetical protein